MRVVNEDVSIIPVTSMYGRIAKLDKRSANIA